MIFLKSFEGFKVLNVFRLSPPLAINFYFWVFVIQPKKGMGSYLPFNIAFVRRLANW